MPVTKTKAIANIEKEALGLVETAQALVIRADDDAHHASGLLGFIADAKKKLEKQRVFLVQPLNNHVKDINAAFKDWNIPLLEADCLIRRKMLEFHTLEQKRIEAERAEARVAEAQRIIDGEEEAEEEMMLPDLPSKTVRSERGTTSVRKTWVYEVTDEAQVPREYLIIDEGVITLAIRDGVREIPGIRIYQQESLTVRGG